MPYLAFQNLQKQKIEISGNNEQQFITAIEKRSDVLHPQLAIAFVKVKKQKAVLAGDEAAADEFDAQLEPLEEEEERAKEAYTKACESGEAAATTASADTAAASTSTDPYAFLKPTSSSSSSSSAASSSAAAPPAEDDFM